MERRFAKNSSYCKCSTGGGAVDLQAAEAICCYGICSCFVRAAAAPEWNLRYLSDACDSALWLQECRPRRVKASSVRWLGPSSTSRAGATLLHLAEAMCVSRRVYMCLHQLLLRQGPFCQTCWCNQLPGVANGRCMPLNTANLSFTSENRGTVRETLCRRARFGPQGAPFGPLLCVRNHLGVCKAVRTRIYYCKQWS